MKKPNSIDININMGVHSLHTGKVESMSGKSILIIDDDEKIIKMLTFLFLSKGYQIFSANNGIEALDILENLIPSVIILDLAMPQMDGFTLYDKMKNQKRYRDIPVIILSGSPAEDTIYKLKFHSSQYYIHKPFRAAEIQGLVAEAISVGSAEILSPADLSSGEMGHVETLREES